MKTLVINTYGGSLLLGAKALGLEIIGSYEDTGFGLPIQQANFPDLDFRPMRKDWPTQDLSNVFGIAHPPCSAFSVMTNSKAAKGVDSKAFACTKSVLQYFVDNNALGFAIESVVGAMAGAWPIHQYYADHYGYNLYRILQNGSMFGAQWRDRFWVVYLKKDRAPEKMLWTLYPKWRTVRQVVGTMADDEASPAGLVDALAKLKKRFTEDAGCDQSDMDFIFNHNYTEDHHTSVDDRLHVRKFPEENRWDICKRYVTNFASSAMVMLNPDGLAPVLLGGSWWYMDGRSLTERAYKQLMGFPSDYVFPEGDGTRKHNLRADMRTYLSKGVMPPVAEWILANSIRHLGEPHITSGYMNGHVPDGAVVGDAISAPPYQIELEPNDIADFRIRKSTWGQPSPALRHYDEHRLSPLAQKLQELHGDNVVITTLVDVTEHHSEKPPKVKEIRVKVPRLPRPAVMRMPRQKSVWNSPEVEASLAETLFTREHTADKYALYESHGYHRMDVQKDDIVLDLGAHIGCVASRAALVGAKQVISVEPEPANYDLLVQNTRSFPTVTTLWGAVAAGEGPHINLHRVLRRDDGGHSTGTHSCTFKTRGDIIQVPRLDFQELLETYQPTILKMDTEGGELGLDWTKVPACVRSIGIELHTQGGKNRERAKEIVAQLEVQGFKPVHALNMESNFSAIIAFVSRDEKRWFTKRTNEVKHEQEGTEAAPAGPGDGRPVQQDQEGVSTQDCDRGDNGNEENVQRRDHGEGHQESVAPPV